MVDFDPKRRALVIGAGASLVWPLAASGDTVIDLEWTDLLPEGEEAPPPSSILGAIHDSVNNLMGRQPASSGVRADWNGKIVRIPGFIVPIDMDGTAVSSFILVPYVGACIHVPPPPANQLVFVTAPEPYETTGVFEAVNVTGMFGTASTTTQLAEVGYALSAEKIEPYEW